MTDYFKEGTSFLRNDVNMKPPNPMVGIYDFYPVFEKLLKDLNLLAEDVNDYDRIALREEYPEETFKAGTVVVYKLGERDFFQPSSTIRPGGSRQASALTLGSSSDIINNTIVEEKGHYFTNKIEFEVFSDSSRHLNNIIKLLESICFKYKKVLKCSVHDVMYRGQTDLNYSKNYFDKRLLSKSIKLDVITCETFSVVSEEMKYIKTT